MNYEICYLVGESKESDLEKIKKKVEKIIKQHQGKIEDVEYVKKRRLAYEIKKEGRGTYVAKRFSLPDKDERDEKFSGVDFIGEITKELNFYQDVLRFTIVKTDDLPELKELIEKEEKKTDNAKDEKTNAKVESKKVSLADEKSSEPEKKLQTTKQSEVDQNEVNVADKKDDVKSEKDSEEKPKEEVKKEEIDLDKKKKKEKVVEVDEDDIDEKLDEILNI